MEVKDFDGRVLDASAWMQKSRALSNAADRLWAAHNHDMQLHMGGEGGGIPLTAPPEVWQLAETALFLYGLALETAFKAYIIREARGTVRVNIRRDTNGVVQSMELTGAGGVLSHDLENLAVRAGMFRSPPPPELAPLVRPDALQEALKYLSDVVTWSGRYPVPVKSGGPDPVPFPAEPPRVRPDLVGGTARQILDNIYAAW